MRRIIVLWLLFWLVLGLWLVPPARGGKAPRTLDLLGGNFPVADYPDQVSRAADMGMLSAAYNPRRQTYLAVWHGFVSSTGFDLYAREVSATGVPSSTVLTLCDSPLEQLDPHVAYHYAADGYWLVWQDARATAGQGVYARRLSASGLPIGAEVWVNESDNPAYYPRVACAGDRCVIAWVEELPGSVEVYARAYDATGNPLTPPTGISAPGGWAAHPDLAANSNGQFFIVWQEWYAASGWDIEGQLLSNTLAPLGAVTKVSATAGDQTHPRLAYGPPSDRFCVVWDDGRSGTADVYAQMVTSSGQLQGGALLLYGGAYDDRDPAVAGHGESDQFIVVLTADLGAAATAPAIRAVTVTGGGAVGGGSLVRSAGGWRGRPVVAYGPAEYLTLWEEVYLAAEPDLTGQRLDASPAPQGGTILLCGARKGQETPAAAHNSQDNQYLVVWKDLRSASNSHIYGRLLSAAGERLGLELLIATEGELNGEPAAVYNPRRNEYLVLWNGIRPGGTGLDISAQRLDASGQKLGPSIFISQDTGAHDEGGVRVALNQAADEYLVVWHGWGGSSWDILAQRLSGQGSLLGTALRLTADDVYDCCPQVVYNAQAHEYLLVWLRDAGGQQIRARRLAADGMYIAEELLLATTPDGFGAYALLCHPVRNEYLLLWEDYSDAQVHAQRLNASALPIGSSFVLPGASDWSADFTALYDQRAAGYLVVGNAYAADSEWDILGARLSSTGVVIGSSFAIASAPEIQAHPALAYNIVRGEVLIVWQDFRNGSYDIYGQLWRSVPLLLGDLDGDCDVDVVDIMVVASRWGTAVGSPNYDPCFDLDSDGDIDVVDIMLVATHWGGTCES